MKKFLKNTQKHLRAIKDTMRNTRICRMGYSEITNGRNNDSIYLKK